MENDKIKIKNTQDIPFKFDSRFVFSDTFIRTSRLISDEKSIENMIMSTQLPYVFTEEPIPLEFDYNIAEGLMNKSYSKLSWSITNKNIPSPILISFDLTENTIEKTVFVIFTIELVKRKAIPEKYYEKINKSFPKICVQMIEAMDKELKEDSKDIYNYESKIFNYSREKIWDILVNYPFKMRDVGVIKNVSVQTPIKEGCEISFNMCEDNKFYKMRITKVKCKENNDKWVLSLTPLEGPFDHYLQEWILIKLGDNQSLLMNNSKYKEHMNPDIFKKITEQKKFAFKTIEDFLKSDNDKNKNKIINQFSKKEDKK